MIPADRLAIAPEVADALASGVPVVALESTLISHGLAYPHNVEVATASEAAIRSTGAVPATVALNEGRLLVGLSRDELEALATAPAGSVRKVSRPNLGRGDRVRRLGRDDRGGDDDRRRVGGHPGVLDRRHRRRPSRRARVEWGAPASFDISADLDELARTPVAVVCAGPKAILDVPLTLEYLETRGVPVVAVGHRRGARASTAGGRGIPAPVSVPDIEAAAAVIRAHEALGLRSGVVVCNPVPEADALDEDVAREAIERALREADEAGITGGAVTPWLLARVAAITEGASVTANVALIVDNARVGGLLAAALLR